MNITLHANWNEYIREQVNSGKYPSADEVVHEALRRMRDQEQHHLEELRSAIAVGIAQADQGLATEFNAEMLERIKIKGRQRMQQSP